MQPDGAVIIGGSFSTLHAGTVIRNHIARLDASGNVDLSFDPDANGAVFAIALQAGGGILIGGAFSTLNDFSIPRRAIARLTGDGRVDVAFDPAPDSNVRAIVEQPDGGIVLAGDFTTASNGSLSRNHIARLDRAGAVDMSFDPDANGNVLALAMQADGRLPLGGNFTALDGGVTLRKHVARLKPDGSEQRVRSEGERQRLRARRVVRRRRADRNSRTATSARSSTWTPSSSTDSNRCRPEVRDGAPGSAEQRSLQAQISLISRSRSCRYSCEVIEVS